MANLTANQESFIKFMTQSEELARRGFDLLLKRPDSGQFFFDSLRDAGLFDPSHNPALVPAEEEGYFRVPYWSALEYLKKLAELSGEKNDLILADKVMTVLRSVSAWREPDGHPRENYNTSIAFADILGLVPTSAIHPPDLQFIAVWLNDRLERGMVCRALDKGLLPRLLESTSPEDWDKAVEVLGHCTAVGFDREGRLSTGEDYWLKELLHHHASSFGLKAGRKAAEVLVRRVREVFSLKDRMPYSRLFRPAIEDHNQNHDSHHFENRSVEGLRDVLLSWCEHDPDDAITFVEMMLADEMEIVRRIGIYVLAKRWTQLRQLYARFIGPKLFDAGHLHELYNLLKERFTDMSDAEKAATIEAIRQIPSPEGVDDPVQSLKRIQQRWLSAIADKDYSPAEEWLAQLGADPKVKGLTEHPDFDSYTEVRFGPGASPYSSQELVAFARAGTIVEKLNSFEQQDTWRGPTVEGLLSTLQEAACNAPEIFLRVLPEFLRARTAFKHSVIWGLKQAWESKNGKQTEVDWNAGWERLLTFFEKLLGAPEFWDEEVPEARDFVPTRAWIVSAIAEFLQAGTRDDKRAYSTDFLRRTWALIQILLNRAKPVDEPSDDAMFRAVNSQKGKAVEALFSHALRVCRVSDRTNGSHSNVWEQMRPVFDAELEKCKNANYAFSTLAGAYLAQLDYMDREWVKAKVDQIFSREFPQNSICAIDGLAYTQANRPLYILLSEGGVLDRALRYELKGRAAREKLLERIALGYLWGDDELESSRFSFIFESGREEDLQEMATFFWNVRHEELSDDQKKRVLQYWERCVVWSRQVPSPPAKLLSALSTLSSYLTTADGKEGELLEAVAPYVHKGHNEDRFFEELLRLAESSPAGVNSALGKAIAAQVPFYDFEGRLKSLLLKLVEKGMKQAVILHAERLRSLPGIQDLFDQLTQPTVSKP